jgi:hypothetical protein
MNWIRIAVGIKADPSVHAIAETCCRNDIGKAVGHVVNVLTELPDHARDGDLAGITDLTLEEWALWRGKSGAFATAFRAHLCTGTRVRGWEKHNGKAVRDNDAARERMKAKRDAEREAKQQPTPPEPPGERSANGSSNMHGTFTSDGTGRDGTNSSSTAVQQLSDSSVVLQQPRDGTAGILPIGLLADRAMARVAGGAA